MICEFDAIYHTLNLIKTILCMSVMHIDIVIFIIIGRVLNMGISDVMWCLNDMRGGRVNSQNNQR